MSASLALAQDRRDTGMAFAADAEARQQPEYAAAAYGAIARIARRQATVHIDDLLAECPITVAVSEQTITVEGGGVTILSRLIDGTFPDYERILRIPAQHRVTVDGGTLANALQRALVVGEDRYRKVVCELALGAIRVEAQDPDQGAVRDEVEAECEAEGYRIAFSAKLGLEAVSALDTDTIEISFCQPGMPFFLRSLTNPALVCAVSPLKA